MKRSAEAGVTGYWAFLTGKKVIYFGRKGEFHVEEFPAQNPSTQEQKISQPITLWLQAAGSAILPLGWNSSPRLIS